MYCWQEYAAELSLPRYIYPRGAFLMNSFFFDSSSLLGSVMVQLTGKMSLEASVLMERNSPKKCTWCLLTSKYIFSLSLVLEHALEGILQRRIALTLVEVKFFKTQGQASKLSIREWHSMSRKEIRHLPTAAYFRNAITTKKMFNESLIVKYENCRSVALLGGKYCFCKMLICVNHPKFQKLCTGTFFGYAICYLLSAPKDLKIVWYEDCYLEKQICPLLYPCSTLLLARLVSQELPSLASPTEFCSSLLIRRRKDKLLSHDADVAGITSALQGKHLWRAPKNVQIAKVNSLALLSFYQVLYLTQFHIQFCHWQYYVSKKKIRACWT